MSDLSISYRYARALMGQAEDGKILDKVSSDVEFIHNTFSSSRQLQRLMDNPVIRTEKKYAVIEEIFAKSIHKETLNFLKFVINKNRENLLNKILGQYLKIRDEKSGVVNAHVLSSVELNDEQKSKLVTKLEKFTGKNIRISYSIDNNILGGFIIRMDDTIIDASLQHQLELLKSQFLKGNASLN